MADYEINKLAKEESWWMFRILGEMVEGIDELSGIEPAVSIYGSARLSPDSPIFAKTEEIAYRLAETGFTIVTGGGPGVMEAANKGAFRAGGKSVGLNISLNEGQVCNAYTTQTITFKHFFVRKVMLVRYATAFIILPGGLGTLDELTEVLTLIQTQKIRPFPVILFDSSFWNGFLDWLKALSLTAGYISEEDLNLLRVSDDVDAVVDIVRQWYLKQEITGKRAVAT